MMPKRYAEMMGDFKVYVLLLLLYMPVGRVDFAVGLRFCVFESRSVCLLFPLKFLLFG